jgi:hypothetical protein
MEDDGIGSLSVASESVTSRPARSDELPTAGDYASGSSGGFGDAVSAGVSRGEKRYHEA